MLQYSSATQCYIALQDHSMVLYSALQFSSTVQYVTVQYSSTVRCKAVACIHLPGGFLALPLDLYLAACVPRVTLAIIMFLILYCASLYCTVLHCTALHCTALYYAVLYCTVPKYDKLCCTVLLGCRARLVLLELGTPLRECALPEQSEHIPPLCVRTPLEERSGALEPDRGRARTERA